MSDESARFSVQDIKVDSLGKETNPPQATGKQPFQPSVKHSMNPAQECLTTVLEAYESGTQQLAHVTGGEQQPHMPFTPTKPVKRKSTGLGPILIKMLTVSPTSEANVVGNKASDLQYTLRSDDVPYRLPSFVPIRALNGHQIKIDDEEYEFSYGRYFKKIVTLPEMSCFGERAL